MSQSQDPGSPTELVVPDVPPPSVRDEPLVESYQYFSCDPVASAEASGSPSKGKAKAVDAPKPEGNWMIGVDEAGRGPVLGPQVYGIAFCKVEYSEDLRSLGFADSKTLSAEQRDGLLDVIMAHRDDIKWATAVMSPYDLSRGMLRKNPYNLNAQSHDTTMSLIRGVLERGYTVTECFVDTVGIASDYQAKLSSAFPGIKFTVTSKADAIYPVVSAASIAAKVTRDVVLHQWKFVEEGFGDREDVMQFGSGYPSDPKTKAWLESNVDPVFGYPNLVRFSWQTVKTILLKKACDVKWDDEPSKIQKYFSGEVEEKRPPLWKDFALHSHPPAPFDPLRQNGTNDAILDEHDLDLLVPLPDEPALPAPEPEQRKDPLAAVLSSVAPSTDPQTLTIDDINTSLTMNFLSALSSTSTSTRLPTFDDDLDFAPTTMSNTSNEMTMEWFNLTFGGIGAEPVYGAASDALDLQSTTSPTPSLVHSTPASSVVSSSTSTLLATPSDPFLFDFASSSFPASLFPTDGTVSPSLLTAALPPPAPAPASAAPTPPTPAPTPSSSGPIRTPRTRRYDHCPAPVYYNGSGFAVNHVVESSPEDEKPLPEDPEARRKEIGRRQQALTRKRKKEYVKALEERVARLEVQVRGLGGVPVE
ncbi:ribonuclease H2 subunit A [Pseudohyphozyma bogoriensis]|nr:ribonuclease H2 subunit A [Pseudohyphozyma bogoriensis]